MDEYKRELTFGEKLAGVPFNPSGNASVDRIKMAAAAYADVLGEERSKMVDGSFAAEMLTDSLRSLRHSQMDAVKAVTWQE